MSEFEKVMRMMIPRLQAAVHKEARKLIKQEAGSLLAFIESGKASGGAGMLKPCPVTGIPNSHRRFSYLMPEARTPENLAKFKAGKKRALPAKKDEAKKLPPAKVVPAKPAPVAVAPIVRKAVKK